MRGQHAEAERNKGAQRSDDPEQLRGRSAFKEATHARQFITGALAQGLLCEQDDAYADEDGGKPAAMVDVFAEKDFGGSRVADVGERGAGGGSEGEVDDREGKEESEEVEGHAERADEEERAGKDGSDGAEVAAEAGTGAEVVEVAKAAHGGGDTTLAGDGEDGDRDDAAPLANGVGGKERCCDGRSGHQRPAP